MVADYFGAGIDDTHIKMRGAPVLEEPSLSSHQKMIADKLTVSELMTMAVVALPPVVKVCYPRIHAAFLHMLAPSESTEKRLFFPSFAAFLHMFAPSNSITKLLFLP